MGARHMRAFPCAVPSRWAAGPWDWTVSVSGRAGRSDGEDDATGYLACLQPAVCFCGLGEREFVDALG